MRWTLLAVALAALLGVSISPPEAAAVKAGPAAGANRTDTAKSNCADYVVIDSRGSGEETSLSAPGGIFYPFFRAAVRRRDPDARLAVIPNGYPAWGSIPTLVSALAKLPQRYHQSVVQGKNWLSTTISGRLANCPDSKLILTGYSQGAQVTGDVYQNHSAKNILAVVLFGDPKFNSADPAARGGKSGLDGALGTRPLFSVAPGKQSVGHVLSYCHDKDPVCQGVSRLRYGSAYHTYGDTDEPQSAAEYVARFVRKTETKKQTTTRTSNAVIAKRGPLTVTYSWTGVDGYALIGRRLQVRRSGRLVYDAGAATARCRDFDPCESALNENGIRITDLDGDTENEIVVSQWEAGTVCCVTWIILDRTKRGYWRTDTMYVAGSPTLIDPDRDGRMQVRSFVGEFKYAYACGACSALPILVYDFDSTRHRLVDVTWRYPALVEADSRKFLSSLQSAVQRIRQGSPPDPGGSVRSVAAAWTANEVRLGRGPRAFRQLEIWSRQGVFDDMWDGTAADFIAKLRADLPKFGIRPFR